MKKHLLTIASLVIISFAGISQTPFPAADSPEYKLRKEQGTLLPQVVRPVDTRTDEQKTKDLREQLAEIHKQHPNIYTSGKEQVINYGGGSDRSLIHHVTPMTNAAGCGALVPCGQGGGTVVDLPGCDDCSSSQLPLGFNFCFYGTNETNVYVNENGNLSFSQAYFNYVPVPFPTTGYDMVAPFWGDVETGCTTQGTVCYEQTPSHFIVTWTGVGYYACQQNLLNTFQVIITNGTDPILPPGENIGVNYGQMQWTTGQASGGVGGFGGSSAIVGVNRGNNIDYFQIGGFNAPGGTFISSASVNNQVGWLTNKTFYFNTCTNGNNGNNANIPPICSTLNNCDTVRVCGLNDTSIITALWLSPEPNQTTVDYVNLNGLTGATILTNTPGNNVNTQVQVIGSAANAGYHVITFMAIDNGTPNDTSIINLTVWIDTSSVSPLNPVIGGALALCGGDSTQLSVTPTYYDAYLWSTGSVNTSIWASTAGQYSVNCWYQGCQKTVSVNIAVHPNPTPLIIGSLFGSCANGTTTLSSDSLIYATYNWSNGDATSSVVVGQGTYALTVIDSFGCTGTSASVTVSAPQIPIITAHDDTTFCVGSTANLWVNFTGPTVPPSCMLSTSGGCAANATTQTVGTGVTNNGNFAYPAPFGNDYYSAVQQYLYTAAELTAAGVVGGKIDKLGFDVQSIHGISTYHEFTIQMGCTNLTTFGANPNSLAPGLFTVFPASTITVTTGWNTFNFATAFEWDGVSNIVVQVCFSEYSTFTATQNSHVFNTATANYSSQEYVSYGEDACTSQIWGSYLSQQKHPNVQLHNCSLVENPTDFTYNWVSYPAGGNVANPSLQNTTAIPNAPTTDYAVTVTSISSGCAAIDTVIVNTINLNAMQITPVPTLCPYNPIDTLHINIPLGTGTFAFNGPGLIDNYYGVIDPAALPVGYDTIYYNVVNNQCGSGSTYTVVHVEPVLDPTITQQAPMCSSYNPVTLTAASPNGTWSGLGITNAATGVFNPQLPGLVGYDTITYTIATPCFSQDTMIIHVVQQKNAAITPPSTLIYCVYSPDFNLTGVEGGGTWSGQGIVNATSGQFSPSTAGAGTWVIKHYYNQFCGDTASITLRVVATPLCTITATPIAGCAPLTVDFTSSSNTPGGTTLWNFGDGNTSTSKDIANTYTSYHNGVPYYVSYQYKNPDSLGGCLSAVYHDTITVYSQPVAMFIATPQPTDIVHPQIQFLDHSTGVINNWSWTFGTNNGFSINQNPTYTYADTGTFHVQLIVSNAHCADTTNENVIISPVLTCYIPNAFSPNGDGNDDVFRVRGTNILPDDFSMTIFDRWGEEIFQSSDISKGWNGSKNNSGAIVEFGVYVYKIHLQDWRGIGHDYIGQITVIR